MVKTEDIIKNVWQGYSRATKADVHQYIHMLRKKIEIDPHNPKILITIRGTGMNYVLESYICESLILFEAIALKLYNWSHICPQLLSYSYPYSYVFHSISINPIDLFSKNDFIVIECVRNVFSISDTSEFPVLIQTT